MSWLPRLLFRLTLGVALLLVGVVLLAPVLDRGLSGPRTGWRQVLALFAADATLRRTAVASALGLLVTACVFFRGPPPQSSAAPEPPRRRPRDVVGA